MKTSTSNGPTDRETANQVSQAGAVSGKAETTTRCRLCGDSIVLESNFRPAAVICPHCGLKFVFDPQEEPLPVRGLRLRYADVLEAQRRPGTLQHRRHEAHVRPIVASPQRKTNYLAWAGGLALALAATVALFGGWLQRIVVR
jgi:hypothetical protein